MLKKLKYGIILAVCSIGLVACENDADESDENETTESEKQGFVVEDIFENYKEDGNKITTIYGIVEYEDYTKDLTVVQSDVAVTSSYFESSKKSLLTAAGYETVDETFLNEYCKTVGLTTEEELDAYITNLIKMLGIYNTKWADIYSKFKLVEYNEDAYNHIYSECEEYYTTQVEAMGYSTVDEYCEAMGVEKSDFEAYYYNVEGVILENIINIVIAKQQGLELTEENTQHVLENIAFQNGITSTDEAKELIADEYQLTVANYLMLEWLQENTKVVADIEAEGTIVDQTAAPSEGDTIATVTIKDYGVVKIRLFDELAPLAVENFVTHSNNGYYNGLTFHRVIDNFMIQGGDPNGDGTGGESIWGEAFEDEFSIQLLPIRGALCMANSGTDTNGSQFFIIQSEDASETYCANWLDMGVSEALVEYYRQNGGYGSLYKVHTVFGQVYEGMDVIDAIAAAETDSNDKPVTDVVIESIQISTY